MRFDRGHDNRYLRRDFVNGSFQESFNALVTSDGAIVTMTLTNTDSDNFLTMQFSDAISQLDVTSSTIALTAGSDTSPTENFIYIPQSTKILTKSTSDWPNEEHIKISYFLVPSAGFVQSNGVYVNQNWNDHLAAVGEQGHATHIAEVLRRSNAKYFSGVSGNGTDDYLTPTAGNVELKSTAGVVYQLHKHAVNAFDTSTGDVVLVKNWNGDAYHDIANLYDIVADSTGTTIGNNKYFNLVLWAAANKTGEYSPMVINLPSGFYNSQSAAENDTSGYDDFDVPREFNRESSTGFMIARITCQMKTGGGTWVVASTVDLRGTTPQIASGGASGVATDFADNTFTIFDETDNTKEVNFDVGTNVSTATTRTLQIPDADGSLALTSQTDGTIDHGADISGLGDDDHTIYLLADGTRALAGAWNMGSQNLTNVNIDSGSVDSITSLTAVNALDIGAFDFRALSFTSDVTTGTPPLVVTSTTEVANLHAATSSQWATTRTIDMSGDVTSNAVNIDGSGNVTITNSIVGDDSHNHTNSTITLAANDLSDFNVTHADGTLVESDGAGYVGITPYAGIGTGQLVQNPSTKVISWQAMTSPSVPAWSVVLAQGHTTSGTNPQITAGDNLEFRDSAIYITSPSDTNLDIIADGGIFVKPASTFTIGSGAAGVDYILKFDGQTNDGQFVWMEDEDYFRFDDSIYFNTTTECLTTALPTTGNGVCGFRVDTASFPGVYFERTAAAEGDIAFENSGNVYHQFGVFGAARLGDVMHTNGGNNSMVFDASAAQLSVIDLTNTIKMDAVNARFEINANNGITQVITIATATNFTVTGGIVTAFT